MGATAVDINGLRQLRFKPQPRIRIRHIMEYMWATFHFPYPYSKGSMMTAASNHAHDRRLWSLLDIMHRFRTASFGTVVTALARAGTMIEMMDIAGMPPDDEQDRKVVRDTVADAEKSLAEIPLSLVLRSQFARLKDRAETAKGSELAILLREFHNNLMVELSSAWFLMISTDQREKYEQKKPPFGENVSRYFLEASADIEAASRCFALDEWTACVFHLMRALEHGLRRLASTVGLPPESMQHENWKTIIDQIEKKIGEMQNLPKSPEKHERLKNLSEAATQFRYFKDAWRNHVAHAHASYDNRSGPLVWEHVKTFMKQTAKL